MPINGDLKDRLMSQEFGLSEEQVGKLETAGLTEGKDFALLTGQQIAEIAGVGIIAAMKIGQAFAPTTPDAVVAPAIAGADPNAIVPEGAGPTPQLVNSFANSVGLDPSMLSTFMFANMVGGAGVDMDLSNMLPAAQIVPGYSPKRRDMPFLIMGQLEKSLGTPIVVINPDGSVNHTETIAYVMSLQEGFEPAPDGVHYNTAGDAFEIVRVGVDAQSVYDSDPLDSRRALQKNGMGIGRINWHNIALDVKQVVYFAVTVTKEIQSNDPTAQTWLRDNIKPGVSRMKLQGIAPNAISEFNRANRSGSLPNLRVMLERGPRKQEIMPRRRAVSPRDLSGIGKNNPFGGDDDRL